MERERRKERGGERGEEGRGRKNERKKEGCPYQKKKYTSSTFYQVYLCIVKYISQSILLCANYTNIIY